MSHYESNQKRATNDRRSFSPPPPSPRYWRESSKEHHQHRLRNHEEREYIPSHRRERRHRSDHRMIRGRSFSVSEEERYHSVRRNRKRSFSDRSRSRSYSREREEYPTNLNAANRYDDRRQDSRRRKRTSRRKERGRDSDRSPEETRHYSKHGRRHHEHQHHLPRHMDMTLPAGIVSDDDEHAETNTAITRQTSRSPGTMARKNQNKRNFNPNRSPSNHDDSVGHFQGGPGTIIADRYRIEQQVGLGTFGKVLECLDMHSRKRRPSYVAMKIVRSIKRYCSSAKIEADIIRQINHRGRRGLSHCVVLHDAFSYFDHYCLVFERLGPSLYDFLKKHEYRPFPMICIQDFTVQLLETMEFLHSFGLIHTDLKIENILLMNDREVLYRQQLVPESTRIKLIDFGGSTYDNSKKSTCINTRQYRAPEVILAAGWSMPSDMWSLGCILAELYKGELLFPTHENLEHLALIEKTIGPFPKQLLSAATKLASEAFGSDGRHRMNRVLGSESVAYVRNTPKLESLIRNPEEAWFLRLLSDILRIDPDQRSTAHECLKYLARINRDVLLVA